MPPPPPRPPDWRNKGPFDNAELRALYGIHATAPSSELVAALLEHLQDVEPSRLFAVVPRPHTPTTEISVRQLQALVTPGRISRTILLTRGSGGSTPTSLTREAYGSHTWDAHTLS